MFKTKLLGIGIAAYYSVCACVEVREITLAEKKLADASLRNLIFLDVTGK